MVPVTALALQLQDRENTYFSYKVLRKFNESVCACVCVML